MKGSILLQTQQFVKLGRYIINARKISYIYQDPYEEGTVWTKIQMTQSAGGSLTLDLNKDEDNQLQKILLSKSATDLPLRTN